jgi:hypothetical protein
VSSYDFPGGQWRRFDNPVIDFEIATPGIFYDMYLELDFDTSQAPENFQITVIMYTPSGEMRSRDIQLDFSSDKNKNTPPGNLRVVLRKDFAFSDKGNCKFEIENRSTKIVTPGMKSIGVLMEKTQ